jgi:hypothetical protein
MIPCRIVVPNPREAMVIEPDGSTGPTQPRALVRGMFVVARIHASPHVELVAVPDRAVRPGGVVWAVRDGQLVIRDIEIVKIENDVVYIDAAVSGLKAGEEVIVSPLATSVDRMPVEVRNTSAPDNATSPGDTTAVGRRGDETAERPQP